MMTDQEIKEPLWWLAYTAAAIMLAAVAAIVALTQLVPA
jgi:hypothetical protein